MIKKFLPIKPEIEKVQAKINKELYQKVNERRKNVDKLKWAELITALFRMYLKGK